MAAPKLGMGTKGTEARCSVGAGAAATRCPGDTGCGVGAWRVRHPAVTGVLATGCHCCPWSLLGTHGDRDTIPATLWQCQPKGLWASKRNRGSGGAAAPDPHPKGWVEMAVWGGLSQSRGAGAVGGLCSEHPCSTSARGHVVPAAKQPEPSCPSVTGRAATRCPTSVPWPHKHCPPSLSLPQQQSRSPR